MKTILITVVLLTGISSFGQRGQRHSAMRDMSPEQVATLETKKLDLALDLNEKQEGQILDLQLEKAQLRESKKGQRDSRDSRPNSDERFTMINEKLDMKIENKEKMKQILNKEQFAKWENLHHNTSSRNKCKVHRGK